MKILYSAGTGGFYLQGINQTIPADAVEITEAKHRQLLEAQAEGATIAADLAGRPIAVSPSTPSLAEVRAAVIAQVKAEAGVRILGIAPIWQQSNDNAALAQELLNRIDGVASSAELAAEVTAALERRTWINAIRAASDLIEADLAGYSAEQFAQLDIPADPRWPDFEEA